MNLYATITSERATKGQGGNKRLDINLFYIDRENPAIKIDFRPIDDKTFYLKLTDNKGKIIFAKQIKGKSQKGEILPFHNHNGCYNQDCAECKKLNGD